MLTVTIHQAIETVDFYRKETGPQSNNLQLFQANCLMSYS